MSKHSKNYLALERSKAKGLNLHLRDKENSRKQLSIMQSRTGSIVNKKVDSKAIEIHDDEDDEDEENDGNESDQAVNQQHATSESSAINSQFIDFIQTSVPRDLENEDFDVAFSLNAIPGKK